MIPATTVMSLSRMLNKPHYIFRPDQVVRRVGRGRPGRRAVEWETVRLPWGPDICIRPSEAIGSGIVRTGVFDLPVSEAIWRLLDPGDLAVDAGANIGYMTSLMATRAGSGGYVHAIEPHPELFARLSENARRWHESGLAASIAVHQVALSDRSGHGRLFADQAFHQNMGTATLHPVTGLVNHAESRSFDVHLVPLDDLIGNDSQVGLLKIDVEGHELSVLRGARRLLADGRVRDILIEERRSLPTPVSESLRSYGYSLFGLRQRLFGVAVSSVTDNTAPTLWGAPTYLATNQVSRAVGRMKSRGWRVLRPRHR